MVHDTVRGAVEALAVGATVLSGSPLPDVAGVLAACRAYVGNDSGVTHLAAALGLPVVAIFGPSDPEKWAPRGDRVRILRDPCLDHITTDAVLAALSGLGVTGGILGD